MMGPAGRVELSARAFDLLHALLSQPDTVRAPDVLTATAFT